MLSLIFRFVLLFNIMINLFGEGRAGLCAFCAFDCIFYTYYFLSFFSSSRWQGLAAVCDCDTPWTYLLAVLSESQDQN